MANIGACLWVMATLDTDFVCNYSFYYYYYFVPQTHAGQDKQQHVSGHYIYSHQLMNASGYLEFVC